ncbi:TetR/AcrR family transcriptional regulator [Catellatospora tritici]|uniref:TetR/AcrR family transcriptional regulator n=1 Tax=Catellatospora tritici TaxID=2851566 RepID=UPI001C2DA75A|nr:TetR/AcrR family transcriptional regulator [Catellatospora tritici]MBV1850270.1 TetR/AcrR family transcriptional regulator [Catellatospora tritici]
MPEQGVETDRRREILTAALTLAEEKGLAALSMRAVATRVGVTPMALYPHVGSKDALLDGLVDLLLAQLLPAARSGGGWEDRLRAIARAVRGLARRHPETFGLLLARASVTPDAVRLVDGLYAALLEAGVPPQRVPRLERFVSTAVLGFAAGEVSGRFSPGPDRWDRGRSLGDDAPAHRALADLLARPADWDAEFEANLDDLLHVIRRHVPAAG